MTAATPAGWPGGRVGSAAVQSGRPVPSEESERLVTELYQRHRLRLISTALVLVGDRPNG